MKKEIGAIHNYLCKKIGEKRTNYSNDSNELLIKRKDFKRMLGWFNIPSYIRTKVITEMNEMGLVKIKDKQNIILVRPEKKDDGWFD